MAVGWARILTWGPAGPQVKLDFVLKLTCLFLVPSFEAREAPQYYNNWFGIFHTRAGVV